MNPRGRTSVTVVTAVILVISTCAYSFEFAGYCRKMCMWGRGGNLCRCSAVHFAGKRAQDAVPQRKLWPVEEQTEQDYSVYPRPDFAQKFLQSPEARPDGTEEDDVETTEPVSRPSATMLRQQLSRLVAILRRRLKEHA